RELRRELAGGDLRDRQVMHDLADGPVVGPRLPVGLRLRESFHFLQHLGAHTLEVAPQRLDGFGKRHADEYTRGGLTSRKRGPSGPSAQSKTSARGLTSRKRGPSGPSARAYRRRARA